MLKMIYGFQNDSLTVKTRDGLDDILLEELTFVRRDGTILRAPIGSTTDGLSTPKIVRLIPGYDATGDDWWSGVLHDASYRGFLQVTEGVWVRQYFMMPAWHIRLMQSQRAPSGSADFIAASPYKRQTVAVARLVSVASVVERG